MAKTVSLFLLLIGAAIPAAAVSDTTPPQLVAFDFDPKQIDTTGGPVSVTVMFDVTDDLAGTLLACVQFASPSGQTQTECGDRTTGTALDGHWEAVVEFSSFAESGPWQVQEVRLTDAALNVAHWSTETLAGVGFPTALEIVSTPDLTAPTLGSLTFTPGLVDVSFDPVTVEVTLEVSDAASGVDTGAICGCAYTAVTVVSPQYGQQRMISNLSLIRVAGSDLDGSWSGSFVMPRFSEPGNWSIQRIQLMDAAGNRITLTAPDLAAAGIVHTFQVVAPVADVTPPELRDLRVTPQFIELVGAEILAVEVDATDDLSGVDFSPDVPLGPTPFYGVRFDSPSGAQSAAAGPRPPWILIGGTPLDGTWGHDAVIPEFAEDGNWRVDPVRLKDAAGNVAVYSYLDLRARGLLTDLIVVRPSVSYDGTLPAGGGTVIDTAFGGRAQITAPPGVLGTDTLVSIYVLPSPLLLNTPSGYSGAGTYFVNVFFSPEPAMPLPAPGLTVVLPLRDPMIPGEAIDLFRIDPATATLVPSLDIAGLPVVGTVDPSGLSATFTGVAQFSTVVGLVPEVVHVTIDIKPGDEIASINSRSNGKTPVAILSTPAFDAVTMIDVTTLTFGRTGTEESLSFCNRNGEDVNRDGRRDLVCHFQTKLTGFQPGDTAGGLRGKTIGNVSVEGSDSIRVVK